MYLALGSAGSVGPDVTDGRLSGPGPLIRRGSISRQTCRAPIQPAAEWTKLKYPVSTGAGVRLRVAQDPLFARSRELVRPASMEPARRRRRVPALAFALIAIPAIVERVR